MTVKDPANLALFVHHKLLTLLGEELPEILSEKKIIARKWTFHRESRFELTNKTWGLGLSNNKQDNALPLH